MIERGIKKESREERAVREAVEEYESKAHEITDKAGLLREFGFSHQQMRLFNACFAHYLCMKESGDEAYFSRVSSIFLEARRLPFLDNILRRMIKKSDEKDLVIKELGDNVRSQVLASFPDEKPSTGRIRNAANLLSTDYLVCQAERKEFSEVLPGKMEFIREKVFN